jgi:phosphopantothenoylcysteine synthetase/decarboxylase
VKFLYSFQPTEELIFIFYSKMREVVKCGRYQPENMETAPERVVVAARPSFSKAKALFPLVDKCVLTTTQRSTDLAPRYRKWTNFQSPRVVCVRPINYAVTRNDFTSDFSAT